MRALSRFLRLIVMVWTATLALAGVASAQTIPTFAGGGAVYGDGGPATAAQLAEPQGIAIDSAGNVYVADSGRFVVRRIDRAAGNISTFAGSLSDAGSSGDDGPGSAATFTAVRRLADADPGEVAQRDRSGKRPSACARTER